MSRLHGCLFFAVVFFLANYVSAAEQGKIYKPSFRYTGPQSQNIGEEEAEGKDPLLATIFSVLPGVVFHGSGNFYAGDYEFGARLLIGEVIGVGIAAWGYSVIHSPQTWTPYFGSDPSQAGYWIKAAGFGLMALTWIADIATAADAAVSYNKDHQIQFQLEGRQDGLQFAFSRRF